LPPGELRRLVALDLRKERTGRLSDCRRRTYQWVSMRRVLDGTLIAIFVLSTTALFLAHEDPFARDALCAHTGLCLLNAKARDKILYDLAVGALISLLFYVLIVRLPDYQRRQRLKIGLEKHYKFFRKDCIAVMLLVADGTYEAGDPEMLIDQDDFREYFEERVGTGDRWDDFFNKLDERNLRELKTKMEIFRDEVAFVLNNTDILKDEPIEFLKRLSAAIYSMKDVTASYDDKEVLTKFLWELFAGFSFATGVRKEDIVKKMIDAI
jgi:hypothetical protein